MAGNAPVTPTSDDRNWIQILKEKGILEIDEKFIGEPEENSITKEQDEDQLEELDMTGSDTSVSFYCIILLYYT
jgi:hypothetical protein